MRLDRIAIGDVVLANGYLKDLAVDAAALDLWLPVGDVMVDGVIPQVAF
jgi:hypothetical protein